MTIVTYQFTYIGNSTRDERLHTTLIDIPLIDWWMKEMQKNHDKAEEYENSERVPRRGYYKTLALVFSQEIPDGEYPDIEWYPTKVDTEVTTAATDNPEASTEAERNAPVDAPKKEGTL